MKRDEVIALAREAGRCRFPVPTSAPDSAAVSPRWQFFDAELERFAALVAAAEREECAKLAGDFAVDLEDVWVCEKLADAIRSRT